MNLAIHRLNHSSHKSHYNRPQLRYSYKSKYKELKTPQKSTRMGFEPTRAEHNGLAIHRLNHSATSSHINHITIDHSGL